MRKRRTNGRGVDADETRAVAESGGLVVVCAGYAWDVNRPALVSCEFHSGGDEAAYFGECDQQHPLPSGELSRKGGIRANRAPEAIISHREGRGVAEGIGRTFGA